MASGAVWWTSRTSRHRPEKALLARRRSAFGGTRDWNGRKQTCRLHGRIARLGTRFSAAQSDRAPVDDTWISLATDYDTRGVAMSFWRSGLFLVFFVAGTESSAAAEAADATAIARTIKADVAQLVAGLNAHDAIKTTAYDAQDVVSIECGSSSTIGIEADRDGFR